MITPLGHRILIKKIESENKTESGIVLPGKSEEKAQIAIVEQLGSDVDINVNIGDKVIYSKYSGTEVKKGYIIIKQDDIVGVIENE